MSTSPFEGRIAYNTSHWAAQSPVDSCQSRALVNNVLHACDSSAQVLEAWSVTSSRRITRTMSAFGSAVGDWHLVYQGPPHVIRSINQRSYYVRVRLRAACIGSGTIQYCVVLNPAGFTPVSPATWALRYASGIPYPNAELFETSSATNAWLSSTDPFGNGTYGDDVMHMNYEQLLLSQWRDGTAETLGGTAGTVDHFRASICVLARQTSGAPLPAVTGLYAAEYIGD